MKILGTSAEGSWAILVLSSIVLVLLTVFAYHEFVLNAETGVFLALIVFSAIRLAWPSRKNLT